MSQPVLKVFVSAHDGVAFDDVALGQMDTMVPRVTAVERAKRMAARKSVVWVETVLRFMKSESDGTASAVRMAKTVIATINSMRENPPCRREAIMGPPSGSSRQRRC